MTDAGGFDPHDTASRLDERERLLRQIAQTLDLPLAVFRRRRRSSPMAEGPTAAECATMLAAFSRIRDPDLRLQCLAMLEHCRDV